MRVDPATERVLRRYARILAAVLAAGLLGLLGLQLTVDPSGAWGTGHPAFAEWRALDSRVYKARRVETGDWDAVILGTSRAVTGFDPGHAAWGGRAVYNAGLDGTNLWEIARVWDRVAATQPDLERLFVEASLLTAGGAREARADFSRSRFAGPLGVEDWGAWAFGWPTTRHGLAVAYHTVFGHTPNSSMLPDGHRHYHTIPDRPRAVFEAAARKNFLTSVETYNGLEIDPTRVALLQRIVQEAAEHGARVDLVVPPVHAVQLEIMAAMGLEEAYDEWRRTIVQLATVDLPEGNDVRVWDFSGYTGPTVEPIPTESGRPMEHYLDASHFRASIGDRVLRRVYDAECDEECRAFGVRIDAANIDEHLAAHHLARTRWREANPTEVEWVDELYRTTNDARQRALRATQATPESNDTPLP